MIQVKRIYEQPLKQDGFRVLVERLWPRGLTKERAALNLWLKEVAPTPELRKWYSHDIAKWTEFCRRYRKELESKSRQLKLLADKSHDGVVTLVYGARDELHNSAVALKNLLEPKSNHRHTAARPSESHRLTTHHGG